MAKPASFVLKLWNVADLVRSPLNARTTISPDLADLDLTASIRKHGILQDPGVTEEGRIIFGSRRVMAASALGWKQIQCKTYSSKLSPIAEHQLRIEENLRRKDLNPIERATELRAFVDLQTGNTPQKTAAGLLGMTDDVVCRTLALLKLPDEWRNLISNGTADPSHTRIVQSLGKIHPDLAGELARLFMDSSRLHALTVREWEALAKQHVTDRTSPVGIPGSRKLLPLFEPHKKELDVRMVDGAPVAFNQPLWRQLTKQAQEETKEPELAQLPEMGRRERIALMWFNRRLIAYFARHAGVAMKWLPLLQIPHPLPLKAVAIARGQKPTLDHMTAVPVLKKVPASGVHTFLSDYVKALCELATAEKKWLVRNCQEAALIAAAVGISYAKEFPATLAPEELAEIQKVYGQVPPAGKFPKGMEPKNLRILRAS